MTMTTMDRVRKAGVLGTTLIGLWLLVSVGPAPAPSFSCLPDAPGLSDVTDNTPAHNCSQAAVSWQTWVFGQPRSMQFHFYDLLELLYGGDSDSGWSSGHGQ